MLQRSEAYKLDHTRRRLAVLAVCPTQIVLTSGLRNLKESMMPITAYADPPATLETQLIAVILTIPLGLLRYIVKPYSKSFGPLKISTSCSLKVARTNCGSDSQRDI